MTHNNADFERDLSDAFAPVKMSTELHQRLMQVPELHRQRRASLIGRLLPVAWSTFGDSSRWSTFGMTTGLAAACFSLVIGLSLGMNGVLTQAQTVQTTSIASNTTSSTSDNTDEVALLYAAADMPGDLP